MKLKALMLVSVLVLTACDHDPVSVQSAGNGVNVGKLFEVDGCNVYRFVDGGHAVYFSNCNGSAQYNTGGKNNQHVETMTYAVP